MSLRVSALGKRSTLVEESVNVTDDYRRQFAWRAFSQVFDALPALEGQVVVDLGSGAGDVAAELSRRGARVIAIDMNSELIADARARYGATVQFHEANLRAIPDVGSCDGIWCSFTAAYFPALDEQLRTWSALLRPGGWIALTEMDDLFGHEPLAHETTALFNGYAYESRRAGRYDFSMGSKLEASLIAAGFDVQQVMMLPDQELSFSGPADPAVLDAWDRRLTRMVLLQQHFGAKFASARDEFLACLKHPEHRSRCRVFCCIAQKPHQPSF